VTTRSQKGHAKEQLSPLPLPCLMRGRHNQRPGEREAVWDGKQDEEN